MKAGGSPVTDIYPSRHAATPERKPRLDPVVHGRGSADAPIGRAQAEQFDRDVYSVLENIFSCAVVAYLQAAAGTRLSDPAALDPETIVAEPQSREIRSIFEIHRQSEAVARLASDARLADVARFLLDDAVYSHQSRLNYKPGFKGKEFYWHSDFDPWHVEEGMPPLGATTGSAVGKDKLW